MVHNHDTALIHHCSGDRVMTPSRYKKLKEKLAKPEEEQFVDYLRENGWNIDEREAELFKRYYKDNLK